MCAQSNAVTLVASERHDLPHLGWLLTDPQDQASDQFIANLVACLRVFVLSCLAVPVGKIW